MREAAVVYDMAGHTVCWHLPAMRTVASLPDSRNLWLVLWEYRARLGGVGHTHPGEGCPWPSHEDVTTFSAIELALGRRLHWWIFTVNHEACFVWTGPDKYDYAICTDPPMTVMDKEELRNISWREEQR